MDKDTKAWGNQTTCPGDTDNAQYVSLGSLAPGTQPTPTTPYNVKTRHQAKDATRGLKQNARLWEYAKLNS